MNEIILDEFTFLVVETDIKGVITFTNDSFCKLTGYALDDLIGQLHSLIRHADVPKTVFQ
ncbi:MAG: PAS domain-containing protein, partial [Arcobacter sp.]|nr:PAS domain-containing protein [Arcobacter sp.]